MRQRFGTVLAVAALAGLLLAGCGDDSGHGSGGGSSDAADEGPPDFTEIALISQSAVGDTPARKAVPLDSETARDEFAARFANARMGRAVDQAIAKADVPDGQTVVGAVVALGCDVPDEVSVQRTPGGLAITAGDVPSPTEECLVAMTTVALVAVDSSLVSDSGSR